MYSNIFKWELIKFPMAKLELFNDIYAFKYFASTDMVYGQLKLNIRRIFQRLEPHTLKLKNMVNFNIIIITKRVIAVPLECQQG